MLIVTKPIMPTITTIAIVKIALMIKIIIIMKRVTLIKRKIVNQ